MRHSLLGVTAATLVGCGTLSPPTTQSLQIVSLTAQLKSNPGDAKLLMARGELYKKQGQYPEAVADFTAAIAADPTNAAAYADRARSNFYAVTTGGNRAGILAALSPADPLGISADLDRSLELDPAAAGGGAYFIRAGVRLWQFRDAEADADTSAYLRMNPKLERDVRATMAETRRARESVPREQIAPIVQR